MAQSEDLARRFEQSNQGLIKTVEGMTDDQWSTKCLDEGRPVGVVIHHVANSHPGVAGIAQMIANGQELPGITPQILDQMNADHANANASCTRAETLDLLRLNGQQAAAIIRSLSDEQLGQTAPFAAMGGAPVSARQVIEMISIGHIDGHHQGVKAALGQ